MKKIVSIILVSLLFLTALCSCGGATTALVGRWTATKVETASGAVIDFSVLENSVEEKFGSEQLIEYSITINDDSTYLMEYYVNGKQGNNYPKSGTYEVIDEKTLSLEGEGKVVLQDDGTMIGEFDNGEVKHYYMRSGK